MAPSLRPYLLGGCTSYENSWVALESSRGNINHQLHSTTQNIGTMFATFNLHGLRLVQPSTPIAALLTSICLGDVVYGSYHGKSPFFTTMWERKYLPLVPSILCNKQIQARFFLWGTTKTFLPDLCNCSILSSWHEVIGQLWLFEPGLVNHGAWGGAWWNLNAIAAYPIGSILYGVYMIFMVHVGKYIIYGSYGYRRFKKAQCYIYIHEN